MIVAFVSDLECLHSERPQATYYESNERFITPIAPESHSTLSCEHDMYSCPVVAIIIFEICSFKFFEWAKNPAYASLGNLLYY